MALGLSHAAVVIVGEFLRMRGEVASASLDDFVALPLVDYQAWLAGLILSAFAFLPRRTTWCWAVWGVASLLGLYVVLAMPAARHLGYHPGFGLLRDGLSSPFWLDAAHAETPAGRWFLLGFWALLQGGLAGALYRIGRREAVRATPAWSGAWPAVSRVRLVASFVFLGVLVVAAHRINSVVPQHPVFSLLTRHHPSGGRGISFGDADRGAASAFVPLRYDRFNESPDERAMLRTVATGFDGRRPNVVFIVLDAVSTGRVVGPDAIDARALPSLRRLHEAGGVLFDRMVVNSPETFQTSVAMHTAGRFPTWLARRDLLLHAWAGRSMAHDFADNGYRTALFVDADIDRHGLDRFPARPADDTFAQFAAPVASQTTPESVGEAPPVDQMLDRVGKWLAEAARQDRPFFLHVRSGALLPRGSARPDAAGMPAAVHGDRPASALAAADQTIGAVVDALAESGQRDNTLVVVTGNLGEDSAGRRSERYKDETMRGFALFALPPGRVGAVRSRRVIANGDLFPTAAALAGIGAWRGHWRDALAADWQPRVQFFQHGRSAGDWGLRDGRWKFVSRSQGRSLLFDLDADPGETSNLAVERRFNRQVRQYDAMAARWFLGRNSDFVAGLDGMPEPAVLTVADLDAFGLKHLALGHVDKVTEAGFAVRAGREFHPQELIVIDALWSGFPVEQEVEYRWTEPGGRVSVQKALLSPTLRARQLPATLPRPLQSGRWQLAAWIGDVRLAAVDFVVRADATLHYGGPAEALASSAEPALASLAVGMVRDGRFVPVDSIRATDSFVIRSYWRPGFDDDAFRYVLTSPRLETLPISFWVPGGETTHEVTIRPPLPLWTGRWQIEVHDAQKVLGVTGFKVTP